MSHDDNWFRHREEEGFPQAEHGSHVSATGLGLTLLGTVFGVLFVILVLVAYFNSYTLDKKTRLVEGTTLAEPYQQYRAQMEADLALVNGPQLVNRDEGIAKVSKDTAAAMVVRQYAEESPDR
ncbi:MAG: hypothetical protein AAFR38_10975 [Planctomycetota bacterium]